MTASSKVVITLPADKFQGTAAFPARIKCYIRDMAGALYGNFCSVAVAGYTAETGAVIAGQAFVVTIQAATPLPPLGMLKFTVTTTGDSEQEGLKYPAAAGDVSISVVYKNDGTTSTSSGTEVLTVLPNPRYTAVTIAYAHRHAGVANFFKFSFTTATAILAGGKLRIAFPTHDGIDSLFPINLGYDNVPDGGAVDCVGADGLAVTAASCTLVWGGNHKDRPAYIDVVIATMPIAVGAQTISFYGIKNPPARDTAFVDIMMLSLDGTGMVLEYYTYFDLFTPIDAPASLDPVSGGTAPTVAANVVTITPVGTATDATSVVILDLPFPIVTGHTVVPTNGASVLFLVQKVTVLTGTATAIVNTVITLTAAPGGYTPQDLSSSGCTSRVSN